MPPPMDVLESYREAYEPEEQWKLRRAFLERNWDDYPAERRTRLLALAQCFQNIQVLGCSYPARVMDEVNRMSAGLVEDKPKVKRLLFRKINFVKAGVPSSTGATSALDADEDDEDISEDEVDGVVVVAKTGSAEKSKLNARVERAEDSDDDEEDRPRLGFGFSAASDTGTGSTKDGDASAATGKFVFGKSDSVSKPLPFVKSSQQDAQSDGSFQFGVPLKGGLGATNSAAAAGGFVFGNKDPSAETAAAAATAGSSSSTNTFQFGAPKKNDYTVGLGFVRSSSVGERRKSDDLNRHMESTSLDEGPGQKSPRLESSGVVQVQLSLLNDLRSQLRKVRPPLNRSRVEFVMLQVNMAVTASKWKLEISRSRPIVVRLHGVQIATGEDEPAAYEDFIRKVFDPQPWAIRQRDGDVVLEVGALSTTTVSSSPMQRSLPASAEASSSQLNQRTQPMENSRHVYGQIIRNLIEVRNTIWTPNFKSKAAMFGGPQANIQSALNMAFQLAKLKPVRDAIVPGTFLKPEFATINQSTTCLLTFHGVILVTAVGRAKNEAKLAAAKSLYEILESRMKFEIIEKDGRNWLNTFGSGQQDRRAQAIPEQRSTPAAVAVAANSTIRAEYKDLFLVRPSKPGADLQALIAMFASANGLALNFETDAMVRKGINVQICRLTLPTVTPLTFEGAGETKQTARRACIRTALEELIRNCYTIHIKQAIVDGAQEFSKEAMPLGLESQAVQEGLGRQLDEDNVGYRLLRNMGWQGGGLGEGTGLVEPVMLKDNAGGRGLGYEGAGSVSKRFKSHVASTLRVFLRETDVFDELKFSPSFSNVERKEIHTIARRLGLKSKSQNRPEGRVLCISHNIDWRMVLNRLKQTGTLGKYQLLPPNSWTLPAQ